MDKRDHNRFVHDLFEFNDVANVSLNNTVHFVKKQDIGCPVIHRKLRKRKLLVALHAFCMMPNHYHLLVSPLVKDGIPLFMKKLNMGYAKYFNERYKRSGALFQGKYKSIPIMGDPHFSYILHYIHLNPLDLFVPRWRERQVHNFIKIKKFLASYKWSSHLDYFGQKNLPSLTQREFMLDFFNGVSGYKKAHSSILSDFNVNELGKTTLE
jgi:putative transposase